MRGSNNFYAELVATTMQLLDRFLIGNQSSKRKQRDSAPQMEIELELELELGLERIDCSVVREN